MILPTVIAAALLVIGWPAAAQEDAGLLGLPARLSEPMPPPAAPPEAGQAKAPGEDAPAVVDARDYRAVMRDIVIDLSAYARGRDGDFVVLARGGAELLTKNHRETDGGGSAQPVGSPQRAYIHALDGIVLDGLYCGRTKPDKMTPAAERKRLMSLVRPLRDEGRRIVSVDFCRTPKLAAEAQRLAAADGVLQFGAGSRLDAIPPRPPHENADPFTSLTLARNIAFALDSKPYDTRGEWVMKLAETNQDVLVVDVFHRGRDALTAADVKALKYKRLGSRRLLLAALPVASIHDGHFYWEKDWRPGAPSFLAVADAQRPGTILVEYWTPEWMDLLGRYLEGIVDLGFDGVMLDGVDAFRRFESPPPAHQFLSE